MSWSLNFAIQMSCPLIFYLRNRTYKLMSHENIICLKEQKLNIGKNANEPFKNPFSLFLFNPAFTLLLSAPTI